MKTCIKCGFSKSLSEFHKKKANKDGFQNTCKLCRISDNHLHYQQNKQKRLDNQKEYYKNNSEKVKIFGRQWRKSNKKHCEDYDLFKKHGIDSSEKLKMIEKQNNCCAICEEQFKNKRHTHVDHDHKTGKIRAILCHGCNTGIGLLKESTNILKSAILYLDKHSNKE